MSRPRLIVPGPPRAHNGRLRVWWRGRYFDLGGEGDPKSLKKYTAMCARWAEDPNAGGVVDEDDYLMADLVADFLESADAPRTSHVARYEGLGRLLESSGGEIPVRDFGPLALRAWVAWVCSLKRTGKGREAESRFNRTSVRHLIGAVRRVFKWGVSTERVDAGQLAALATVPGPRRGSVRPEGSVSAADPKAVTKALPKMPRPVAGMVKLQVLTGARPSELCRMKVGDVLRVGRVTIPRVGLVDLARDGVWVYAPVEHKTAAKGLVRWLVFGPKAQAVLRGFLIGRPASAYVFDPRLADRRPGRVGYPLAPGDHYSADTYAQAVERACVRAGVEVFTPYRLRHLAAVEIDAAFGREGTAATLGHASIDTTAIYTGRSFRRAVEVAKARG